MALEKYITHIANDWINGREIRLRLPYTSIVNGITLHIPVLFIDSKAHGFHYDGGTIPPAGWALVGHPFGPMLPAFTNHDFRWSFRCLFPQMTFEDSNDLLHSDCLHYQMVHAPEDGWKRKAFYASAQTKAFTIYKAVKYGGRGIWSKGKRLVGDVSYHYSEIPNAGIAAPTALPTAA